MSEESGTNERMVTRNQRTDEKFPLCKKHKDTMSHLMNCSHANVKSLWQNNFKIIEQIFLNLKLLR